jgi:hypothetical protein
VDATVVSIDVSVAPATVENTKQPNTLKTGQSAAASVGHWSAHQPAGGFTSDEYTASPDAWIRAESLVIGWPSGAASGSSSLKTLAPDETGLSQRRVTSGAAAAA